jgi:hypothetical protein
MGVESLGEEEDMLATSMSAMEMVQSAGHIVPISLPSSHSPPLHTHAVVVSGVHRLAALRTWRQIEMLSLNGLMR